MRVPQIISTAYIQGSSLYRDDDEIWISTESELTLICKDLYRQSELKYPKFYKMDLLSKLAILMGEQVMSEGIGDGLEEDRHKHGVFIVNRSSSLHTDELYVAKTFSQSGPVPNPALFVYTLPNIMLGELAIKYGLKGEQAMWISDHFDAKLMTKYVLSLFENCTLDACLIGWIDFNSDHIGAFLSRIVQKENEEGGGEEFTANALQKKYDKISLWNK